MVQFSLAVIHAVRYGTNQSGCVHAITHGPGSCTADMASRLASTLARGPRRGCLARMDFSSGILLHPGPGAHNNTRAHPLQFGTGATAAAAAVVVRMVVRGWRGRERGRSGTSADAPVRPHRAALRHCQPHSTHARRGKWDFALHWPEATCSADACTRGPACVARASPRLEAATA